MQRLLLLIVFLSAAAVAVFFVARPDKTRVTESKQPKEGYLLQDEHELAGRDDYSGPPKKDYLQRCDPLVINAWRYLDGVHKGFFDRYNKATREERQKMQDEVTNLFAWYEPYTDGDIPKNDPKDTPAERAKKAIWRTGYSFEKAIKLNPANACNYVSYAVFLKARNEPLAYDNFMKGIERWPTNYGFHWLLADFLYRTPSSYGFTIFAAVHPQQRRTEFKDEIFRELDIAQKYDPDNGFLRIYRATVMITFTEDALDIYNQFKAAIEMKEYPCFIAPPPRPAKALNWFNAANATTRSSDVHYDIERAYGFYLDSVIERWIKLGGLREAAERLGPEVFITMYRLLFRMSATDPFDRTFFSLANEIAAVMKEYYAAHNLPDAAAAVDTLVNTGNITEKVIRNASTTNTMWRARVPSDIDPLKPEQIDFRRLEMMLGRNNPKLRSLVDQFIPRLVRECTDIVKKHPADADPSAKGKFWSPELLKESMMEEGMSAEIPVSVDSNVATAESGGQQPDDNPTPEPESESTAGTGSDAGTTQTQ
jgi:hypothetical protein